MRALNRDLNHTNPLVFERQLEDYLVLYRESQDEESVSNFEEEDFDSDEQQTSLTDTEIDRHTESFEFLDSKQGRCAIDQEDIRQGDSCRRIKQVAAK
jgi:hypothetical protein